MFLGLNGIVVKSHGGTDALGFADAIGVAVDLVRASGTNERIIERDARPSHADPRRRGPGGGVLTLMLRSVVRGVGAYLPERVVTNDELSRAGRHLGRVDPQRTGIRQRHIAADGELTSDLATAAARARARPGRHRPAATST